MSDTAWLVVVAIAAVLGFLIGAAGVIG